MKKIIPLFFAVICLCTACAKTFSVKPTTIPYDKIDWDRVYTYKDRYTFSQERIDGNVCYINDIDILLEEAIEEVQERMQTAYENGSIPWDSYSDRAEAVLEGRGYYISKIPITKYNNSIPCPRKCATPTIRLWII